MLKLTIDEHKRYERHLILKGFGLDGQLRLKNASVLVVGAGGLGCPVLMYLSAAGIGKIGILDFDRIQVSNLQRQILYRTSDNGKYKAEVAAEYLQQLNPLIEYQVHRVKINSFNALDIIRTYDVIVDCTDNFPVRYLLNDACILSDKPLVYGSILEYEGQVAVFNFKFDEGIYSANYRDIFPQPPSPDSVPNCAEAGVIGVLPGIIGALQANEVIKIIAKTGDPLANRLLIFESLELTQTIIKIASRETRSSIKSLIDYADFCGINKDKNQSLNTKERNMKEVTVQELQELKESGADFQLIDVREPYEYDICNIDGQLIPMSEIPSNVDKISRDKQVVIHCRSGKRSGDMLLWLEKNHNFTNLYNLKGGILAWAREIDPEMPTY